MLQESSGASTQELTLWQSGTLREPTVAEFPGLHTKGTFSFEPELEQDE